MSEKKLALLSHAKRKGMSCLIRNVIEYCMRNLQRDLHYLIATLDASRSLVLKNEKANYHTAAKKTS